MAVYSYKYYSSSSNYVPGGCLGPAVSDRDDLNIASVLTILIEPTNVYIYKAVI